MGKWLIGLGGVIIIVGIVLYFFPNAFKWFGNLPGDIKIEKENSGFYFPITSLILISVVLNVLFRVVQKLN